ncbi:MAG: long-chain fatty acid--CoA ligase [Gaiella sp.]|nr:long-chain fatty acid--CoA ligase [Gaiella sp.]
MDTNIGLFLEKRALRQPEKLALWYEGRELTFREWSDRAVRAAGAFHELGVRKGDRVGLLMTNSPELLECFFGLARIGAIVVPLNWRLAPPELSYIARAAGLQTLVYDGDFAATVDAVREEIPVQAYVTVGEGAAGDAAYEELLARAPEAPPAAATGTDPLLIMFTSGTTGRPKGAVLTHDNLFYESCSVSFSLDWRVDDRMLVAMPLFHIGALILVIIGVHVGSTAVLMREFDPARFLALVPELGINSFLAVAAMLGAMLQVPAFGETDLSSLRWALCGAAPVPVPLIRAWAERSIAIQQVYGLTECAGGAALLGPERALEKAGSTGLPMFHTSIRVVDEEGSDVAAGETGEVLISAPHVMSGYWDDPEATAAALRDGWLHTGDLGTLDDEGYLTIVERKKDLVISGGENIYPAEVESVLASLPQLVEAAVIGVPDPDWGEAVCVVARLKEGETLTLEEVAAHCAGKLGRYKIPKKLVLTEDPLPRTPAGKVLKRVLRETT